MVTGTSIATSKGLERNCQAIDKPSAGLLADLQKRDMLKDTPVMWGGEFGRTPHGQTSDGCDHNNRATPCGWRGAV